MQLGNGQVGNNGQGQAPIELRIGNAGPNVVVQMISTLVMTRQQAEEFLRNFQGVVSQASPITLPHGTLPFNVRSTND